MSLMLIPYDQECLDLSWFWLNDAELRELTLTPKFTREDQKKFFASLLCRTDYRAWGVRLENSEIIGAAGLKNHRASVAEYWGYIGEKKYWGKGLGQLMVAAVESMAHKYGFTELDLKVGVDNERAISLYKKTGFVIDECGSNSEVLRMVKRGI